MTLPWDDFERPAGALGTSTSGDAWTLRPTGPYDDAGATIAQETSIITLSGAGSALFDPAQAVDHLQFATLDHGTGDSPADRGWEVEFNGNPTIFTGIGLVFRWQDPTHYWNAFFYNSSTSTRMFLERQNGASFAAASPRVDVDAAGLTVGFGNVIRVIAIGSDIAVYLNDVELITMSDSSFATAPHHGISNFHSGITITRFNYGTEQTGLTVGPLHMRAA